ncbi:hypothetical protein WA026_021031 [Henosepilachna vigintioctopunctata]|uniref:Uncharacterized protein n=1 Tax=Henosepilachna vigintioctopunctata TaxID=420089 RepID=A0AAW1V164_9CUCU
MARKNNNISSAAKIISLNVCGIKQRMIDIEEIINEEKPDVVALQETKLNKKQKFSFLGYEVYRNRQKEIWIYIYRINRTATEVNIKKYVKNKQGSEYDKLNVEEITSEKNSLRRYLITAPIEKEDEMHKSQFWPRDKMFRFYLTQKFFERTRTRRHCFIGADKIDRPVNAVGKQLVNDITVTYINKRSISTSFNSLEKYIHYHDVYFLAVTEHCQNYDQLLTNKLHAIYAKRLKSIKCKRRSDLNKFSIPHVTECSALEYSVKSTTELILISIDRPKTPLLEDSDTFLEKLPKIIDLLTNEKHKLYHNRRL